MAELDQTDYVENEQDLGLPEMISSDEDHPRVETSKELKRRSLIEQHRMAVDRTLFSVYCTKQSNDRTFLGFIQLAVNILVAGTTIIRFFGGGWYVIVGYSLLAISPIILGFGLRRYWRFHNMMSAEEQVTLDRRI